MSSKPDQMERTRNDELSSNSISERVSREFTCLQQAAGQQLDLVISGDSGSESDASGNNTITWNYDETGNVLTLQAVKTSYLCGKRRAVTSADRAAIQSYRSGHKTPVFSTDFTDPAELQADWNLMSDDGRMCRRPTNVEASKGGLRLKTLTASAECRNKSLKWSTGSIQSKAEYPYGFFEATMKIADIKGMNNAFWMNTANQLCPFGKHA